MFPYKKDGRGEGACTRLDQSLLKHEVDLVFNLVFLVMGISVGAHIHGFGLG